MRENRFKVFTPKKTQLETPSFWEALKHIEKLRKSGKYPTIKLAYRTAKDRWQEYPPHEYRPGKLTQ